MKYSKEKRNKIRFPLGGIGTGSISVAGDGHLVDWEIFNRPNKGTVNGFSHFAIKAEKDNGEVIDVRALNGGDHAPMRGIPHFKNTEFEGTFPVAHVTFQDPGFPGTVKMKSFNPFIPLNDLDSSIPASFFEFYLENNTDQQITYSVCLSVANPATSMKNQNEKMQRDGLHLMCLRGEDSDQIELDSGHICFATDAEETSFQQYWYRGLWRDQAEVFWREFSKPGNLANRIYTGERPRPNPTDVASLAAHKRIAPGHRASVRFIMSWHYPHCHNYWSTDDAKHKGTWKNYYTSLFKDAAESSTYGLQHWDRLESYTDKFVQSLTNSKLPTEAIEAITGNLSTLKSTTCLRLEDGSFYAFEGSGPKSGSCEGSCTHVWNYAYALPFLFPKLERSMRDLDYRYNQRADGKMAFRLQLPLHTPYEHYHACVDGQYGNVVKMYRDWKISGDTEWLRTHWEAICRSIEFAWSPTNEDQWDPHRRGVIEGCQHHTLDRELIGPNAWLTGFYLAALKAAAEMAGYLGESNKQEEYAALFAQGKHWVSNHLFNGQYFVQKLDIHDSNVLSQFPNYSSPLSNQNLTIKQMLWCEENKQLKYQIAEGCLIDQVVAQWHANLSGLGNIFDPIQTREALASIYSYNYKDSVREYANVNRTFIVNDESGVVMCEWPEGTDKPVIPIAYYSEVMSGFEYQLAAHMIQEGMLEEGLNIIRAIRSRYDGDKRNPWNEPEAGNHYARAMASYSLLLAYSGFSFDAAVHRIGFNPVIDADDFQCFWSLASGWGNFVLKIDEASLIVLFGKLIIRTFELPKLNNHKLKGIYLNGTRVDFIQRMGLIEFDELVCLENDMELILRW